MEVGETFVEDFLEHHGVKGMKWGVRKDRRAKNREANRAAKKADRDKWDKNIDRARKRVKSGKSKERLNLAKAQYQIDKINQGKYQAKQTLNKERDRYQKDVVTSQWAKNGKEKALAYTVLGVSTAMYLGGLVLIAKNT